MKIILLTSLFLSALNSFSMSEKTEQLMEKGKVAFLAGKQDRSINYFNEAITAADKASGELAEVYYRIGRFYADHSIDEMALKYYFIALDESEKAHQEELTQEIHNYIGGSYFNRLYYLQAKKHWKLSRAINERIGNKKGLSSNLNNIGEIERVDGNERIALDLFLTAGKLKREIGDSVGLSTVLTNIAGSYIALGHADSALIILNESYGIAKQLKSVHLQEYACQTYGKYYLARGEHETALKWYHEVLALDKIQPNPDYALRKNVYTDLMVIHESLNHLDSTLMYQLKLNKIESELLRKEKKILQTASEIGALIVYRDNEIKTLKMRSDKNSYIAYSAVLLSLVLAISVILYFRQRNKVIRQKAIMIQKERELLELKSRFITAASHQFRTPLTTIRSSLAPLLMQKELLSEEMQVSLEKANARIRENVGRMTVTMDNIVLLERIAEENYTIETTEIDLGALCSKVAERLKQQRPGRDIKLKLPDEPVMLKSSEKLLDQIICNLLDNALSYSEGQREPELLVSTKDDTVSITVKDYGKGIAEKDLPYIYEPFFRVTGSTEQAGSGLGLTIVKECVHLLGGTMHVKSELGKGSEFEVELRRE